MKNKKEPRLNEAIDCPEVRLIAEDGAQVGVVPTSEAFRKAQKEELDLVEISPTAKPPVCRIMDYGKFKYQQQKREHDQRKKSHGTDLKQIRIKTFRIDPHDLQIKLKKAREFLLEGHRLLFTLMFRAREHAHADLGVKLLKEEIAGPLADLAKMDSPPRKDGRRMTMTLQPLPNVKKKVEQQRKLAEAAEAEKARQAKEAKASPEEAGHAEAEDDAENAAS